MMYLIVGLRVDQCLMLTSIIHLRMLNFLRKIFPGILWLRD
ncbi:hypothetical protein Golob_022441 [Gossypium lobatum]|uniref:Uncharacterized protein n=1 Tax=Gossypium lobatum TaxID=34289 RepID=A0A7J8LGL6_9ROSI|nr:hypothetical protein [Gossypium lobatum]